MPQAARKIEEKTRSEHTRSENTQGENTAQAENTREVRTYASAKKRDSEKTHAVRKNAKQMKQQIATGIAAVVMIGITAGVVIYIITRELRETLTHTNIDNAPASKDENMNIEHSPTYNQSARGYRNNNPLNLRISSNNWKGKVPAAENTDGAFEQFTTMAYGFRAALKNLQAYISKYRCNTIQSIVNKWAPASDGNNPASYAARVAQTTGYAVTTKVAATDREKLCRIAYAMAIVENGSVPVMADIYAGWDML